MAFFPTILIKLIKRRRGRRRLQKYELVVVGGVSFEGVEFKMLEED
jgi:hypothetical protein